MKFRVWRRIKWRCINLYIRTMLRIFGDEIGEVSKRIMGGKMKRSLPNQKYFVESLDASSSIDRLEFMSGQRLNQLEWLENLNWKTIHELKQLCKELGLNYKKRFLRQDKFLEELGDKILSLNTQYELIMKLVDAVDSFCGGDFNAVEEINES